MDSASYRPAQRFGWVPPSTLTAQHSVQVENPTTIFPERYDDAVPATPWAGTVALKPGEQDLAYWAPFSTDLPPTIIRRSRRVKPLKLPHGVKYPVMVALTVASLSSANLLSSATSTAQAAPADEDSTGSFQAIDPTQGDQDIVAAPTDGDGSATHAVQQGDTLKSIAANYGVDLSTLIAANGLANPDLIYPGDQIYVPGDANYAGSSVTVTVQPGDTLFKLASQYGVSVTAIINYEANGITNPDLIHPGQEITIPGGVAQASPEPVVEPQQENSTPEPVSVEPEPEPEPQPDPQPEPEPEPQPEPEPEPQVEAAPEPQPEVQQAAPAASSVGQQIVNVAMQFQGAPYVWGATGPGSFDCTGFTFYVVNQVLGGGFPRDMGSQASFGTPVSPDNLQPGDIVFQQNTYKAGMSHAGIYIGGGQFINAANESVGVTISNLWDSYWGPRYHSAVRIQ